MACGELTICALPGPWRMAGASVSKQCCSKHCCSLNAADAIGAAAIAIATAPATKAAVMALIPVPTATLPRPQNRTARQDSPHRWHASTPPASCNLFRSGRPRCRSRPTSLSPTGRAITRRSRAQTNTSAFERLSCLDCRKNSCGPTALPVLRLDGCLDRVGGTAVKVEEVQVRRTQRRKRHVVHVGFQCFHCANATRLHQQHGMNGTWPTLARYWINEGYKAVQRRAGARLLERRPRER
jgi:hypothetical protein